MTPEPVADVYARPRRVAGAAMEETGADGAERQERETAAEWHDAERSAVITPYPDGPLILRGRFVITGRDSTGVPAGSTPGPEARRPPAAGRRGRAAEV